MTERGLHDAQVRDTQEARGERVAEYVRGQVFESDVLADVGAGPLEGPNVNGLGVALAGGDVVGRADVAGLGVVVVGFLDLDPQDAADRKVAYALVFGGCFVDHEHVVGYAVADHVEPCELHELADPHARFQHDEQTEAHGLFLFACCVAEGGVL